MKVIIIGGVAGGATAAARLRRLDESAKIILLEKDEFISFANCGLPYYVGGVIEERGELLLQTPESFNARFNIDVRVHNEVIAVDTAKCEVKVRDENGREYIENYDALLLAPGCSPVRLPVDEGAQKYVYTLRNIADVDLIYFAVAEKGLKQCVIIGGGFIGVELAENLIMRGLSVRIVEALPHILPPFDEDIAILAEEELKKNGVELSLGSGVSGISAANGGVEVTLNNGEEYAAGIIIMAAGVRPVTAFLKDSGIALGERGHIITNEHMQTNVAGVYAAGDAVLTKSFVFGDSAAVPLAGPANRQARVAADNIAGLKSVYGGVQGTAIIKLFEKTAACTGTNEKTLKARGIKYLKAVSHPFSHATYYPGAETLAAKLLFDEDGKILGASMFGGDGVDKRIDIISTAQRLNAGAADLATLELCYAPPFGSAKDPVNMLGYIAENILNGVEKFIDYSEIGGEKDAVILDVRTRGEYSHDHEEGAINIPVDELRTRLNELDKSKNIILYCQVGVRAHTASRILIQNGFNVKSISGGYKSMR